MARSRIPGGRHPPATELETERLQMDRQLRIWGSSLILLGLLALFGLDLLQLPAMFTPFWSALAIGLGAASFWLKHPALLLTYAVFLGVQGVRLFGSWVLDQISSDTIVLAVGILLVVYALRLGGEFRRARHLPLGPADDFALGGIAAALLGPLLGIIGLATRAGFLVADWLDLTLLALGLSLGAVLTTTRRPGLAKISLGVSLLGLMATIVVLPIVTG